MVYRSLIAAGAFAGFAMISTIAAADPGVATGNVNMRSGPGTQYPVITTIPAGAPIEVMGCQSWCQVAYAGAQGYVSGRYVGSDGYSQLESSAYYRAAPRYYAPAPPPRVYYRDRWDDDYGYYSDDWRWRRHRWGEPDGGIYFGFGF